MKKHLAFLVLAFFVLLGGCREENPHEVERNKSGKYVLETEEGQYVIAATKELYDYDQTYFLKVNNDGSFQSSYRFGLTGNEIPVSLGVNYNGNYVVLTNSQPAHSGASHCRFVICEENGKPITFEEITKNNLQGVDHYIPTGMVRNPNNTYTITGNLINDEEEEPFFARVHEGGSLEWLKSPEFVNNRRSLGITTTTVGKNIIVGSVGNQSLLFKIDKKGDFLWTESFDILGNSFAQNIFETEMGDLFVMGRCGTNLEQSYLLKTSFKGDSLWTRIYPGELPENVGFQLLSNEESVIALNHGNQYQIIKNNSQGELIWEKTFQSDLGATQINAIRALESSELLLVGDILNVNGVRYIYISKFDASGNQIWETGL